MERVAIGIDVGGTGIKGAGVDPASGTLVTERYRVPTPAGGTPGDIARVVGEMAEAIRAELAGLDSAASGQGTDVPTGVTLPSVVRDGIVRTAANIDASWIGIDARALLSHATDTACTVLNDADAAGVAESSFGAARGLRGTTMVLTFGTGIGSAFIADGALIPNFELGHLHLDGHADIERHASARAIKRDGISLAEWAARAERFVAHLELIINPDRFVLGGSISADADRYLPFVSVSAPVVPAQFRNNAGIVGAAWLASRATT